MSERDLLAYQLLEENEDEEILLQVLDEGNSPVHPIYRKRREEGCFTILINRNLIEDGKVFREYFRLNIAQFNFVLDLIRADLKKNSSGRYAHPITPEEKLAVTLRFLATGESFKSISFALRISPSYISRSTLSVLRKKLMPPLSPDDLKTKSQDFEQKWDFPNCVGAIDGKHVRIIVSPALSGSLYFNYKQFFSVVLLAVVHANYKFIFTDVGSYGKEGDSEIFEKSDIGKLYRSGRIFPPPCKLSNSDIVVSHVCVGDEAFRLDTNMMKPYSRPVASTDSRKAIFNYRLSRARRVSENVFALLSQVFRIFYTPIAVKPDTTVDLIISACCLHNLLRDAFLESMNKPYYELDPTEPPPSKNLLALARAGGFANIDGFSVRDSFTKYFNSRPGAVPWQNNHIARTH